jgi:hypothetical protein
MTSRIVMAEGLEDGVPQSVATGLKNTLDLILSKDPTARITPVGSAPGGVPTRLKVYVPPTNGAYFGGKTYFMRV